MLDPRERPAKKRHSVRASITYKEEGFLSFLRKPSPRLPVLSVTKEGMEFRTIEALRVGGRVALLLRSAQHHKPCRIRAEVSAINPETRIGEQTYAFRVEVKFVEISSEAWSALHNLIE